MGTPAWSLERRHQGPDAPWPLEASLPSLPRAQGLGEQVLAEPSVMVPVDKGYPQSLEKEGQKIDLWGLPLTVSIHSLPLVSGCGRWRHSLGSGLIFLVQLAEGRDWGEEGSLETCLVSVLQDPGPT